MNIYIGQLSETLIKVDEVSLKKDLKNSLNNKSQIQKMAKNRKNVDVKYVLSARALRGVFFFVCVFLFVFFCLYLCI
jgi:hypothetical protein